MDIYYAVTGVLQQFLHVPQTVTKIQASPDGSILFFSHPLSVTMWDIQTGGLIHTFITESEVSSIAVSMAHIACGFSDGSVIFWNTHTKEKGGGFGNGQPVVSIYWLSPRKLAVATQSTLYVHDIIVGDTSYRLIPGNVWGMVYLEDKGEFLVGASRLGMGAGQEECFFTTVAYGQWPGLEQELPHFQSTNLLQSFVHGGQLSSPTLVDKEIVCIIPTNGVQLFNTSSYDWTNSPPLLGAATSVAV